MCPSCHNDHFFSYAFNKLTKKKHFYKDAHEGTYLQCSQESLFELELLHDLNAQIVFNHMSFNGFCKAYNYRYGLAALDRIGLNMKRLAEAFYTFHLSRYYSHINNELIGMKC